MNGERGERRDEKRSEDCAGEGGCESGSEVPCISRYSNKAQAAFYFLIRT